MVDSNDITRMLSEWRAGDDQALAELMPLVYDKLHSLAARYMRQENSGHTLQATALVNEAYLKLCHQDIDLQNRAHFLAISARAMRQVLVDHARNKQRHKRGGKDINITLHEADIAANLASPDMLDVNNALDKLQQSDERKARIVELSFFGGMTYDEIGETLGISAATVDRELRFSKAWLQRALTANN